MLPQTFMKLGAIYTLQDTCTCSVLHRQSRDTNRIGRQTNRQTDKQTDKQTIRQR